MAATQDVRRCPDGTPVSVADAQRELRDAIGDLPLSPHELRVVSWLYRCDQPTMHAIATIIAKAKVR